MQITASLLILSPKSPPPTLRAFPTLALEAANSHGGGAPDRAAGGGGREAGRAGRAPPADAVDYRAERAEGPGARGEGRHGRGTQVYFH